MYDESLFEGDDDDIFQTPQTSSEPSIRGHVPGYLRDALNRYVKENPHIKESFTTYKDTSHLVQFMDRYTLFETVLVKIGPETATGPLARSIVSVLDTAVEGSVQRRYAAYVLEPVFIGLHLNLMLISEIHQAIIDLDKQITSVALDFVSYLEALAEIYSHSVRYYTTKYMEACQLAGIQPDMKLIQFGLKDEGDFAFATSMHTTQAQSHYIHGDVSSITSMYDISIRKNFVKYFVPLLLLESEAHAKEAMKDHFAGV